MSSRIVPFIVLPVVSSVLFGCYVTVPDVTGQAQASGESVITGAGSKVGLGRTAYAYSDTVGEGNVISQDPAANSSVSPGTFVSLLVSLGAEPRPTETIMLPGKVPLEMVSIPAGTFMMGRYSGERDSTDGEDPQHEVTISSAFWLGKYEVTKAQWEAVMGTTPWSGQRYVLDEPDSPIIWVSWNDAQAFIAELNAQTGESFRLPSEAQWEYACRAGTTTRFSYGDDADYSALSNYAWWSGNADNVGEDYAHVVGRLLPNPWGLYDLHGNVWEWCQDWWQDNYSGAPADGSAWELPPGQGVVMRGGGWGYGGRRCRSANRGHGQPDNSFNAIGFRLAR